jgi:murein DD-endopeptidase MepM/ murein hydrolase activator NlpD
LSRWSEIREGAATLMGRGRLCRAALQMLVIVLLSLVGVGAAAAYLHPQEAAQALSDPGYVVQPGDTVADIAARAGVPVEALVRANDLRNPRLIYPGQRLTLPGGWGTTGVRHVISAGESVAQLSRGSGASLQTVAWANQLLLPTRVPLGWSLWLPERIPFRVVPFSEGEMPAQAPRVTAAMIFGARLWDVLWLNPVPHHIGQEVLVPDEAVHASSDRAIASDHLPFPLTALSTSPQPVSRGETLAVVIAASEPVTCRLRYFDQEADCRAHSEAAHSPAERYYALAGLSPLMTPGAYTLTLVVTRNDGTTFDLPISLQVGPGRYDYERIDLPPDRQSLLDPALSQHEREKIAQMRGVRSETRLWEYPFQRPVDAATTSYFGSRRSYGYGFDSFHAGSDFDGVGGELVIAPASGIVLLAEPLVVRGNAILVDHGWGLISGFWHLSEISVTVGQRVSQGELLGLLGNTGLSTGAHLHWELWVNGAPVNPLTWLDPEGPGALVEATP